MNYLITIGVSVLATVLSTVGVVNVPLKYLEFTHTPTYGSTITTILGTDTLSSSRAVINTNFANLNADKIEATQTTLNSLTSASSLATVGTITSGTWHGTPIEVAYNGTGTTSPTLNQIFLGNGASGFKVVSGLGTSGQFLTSNGASNPPSWSTGVIDQAGTYAWTGIHSFAASTTMATTTKIGETFGGLSPAGSITAYASTTAPAGWILADGTSYATTTFPNLFAVIGYSYGGSGANFNVPNLKGRNILMASTTANVGQTGGESNHTQTVAEMPSHSHTADVYTGPSVGTPQRFYGGDGAGGTTQKTTNTTGSGNAFNVLDPYMVLQYIIKY